MNPDDERGRQLARDLEREMGIKLTYVRTTRSWRNYCTWACRYLVFRLSRTRFGFEQQRFVGHLQLLEVWAWSKTRFEVWHWEQSDVVEATAWLDQLPVSAKSERYRRIQLSAQLLCRTDKASVAFGFFEGLLRAAREDQP